MWAIGIYIYIYYTRDLVLSTNNNYSKFLYPISDDEITKHRISGERNANMYPNFQFVMDQIVASLQELLSNTDVSFLEKDSGTSSMITGAFSMALCCKLFLRKNNSYFFF